MATARQEQMLCHKLLYSWQHDNKIWSMMIGIARRDKKDNAIVEMARNE